ncbi:MULTISPECIES: hypothetical protein [Halolamina]|uniref:Uncharacterized protein n=1 Tax=Halolamina pelagica TaxID=699431 RepID=A0A1I5MJY2_9EURY|nr:MULTISPECIES: hypothetical protein [Halolamina]NHX36038.1 hypothetical protein [Halolamina sp. R1-12]SFP09256.1 hypothetical protein SAMN05216277_101282 [Halolamina pelagica]
MALAPRRTFWLALCWLGATQSLSWAIAVVRVGVWPGNVAALAGFLLVTFVALLGVARPELAGGPEDRTPIWWAAVVAAALGTVGLLL